MKSVSTRFLIVAGISTAFSMLGQNLLVNGDFESGNAGFRSAYSCSHGNLWNTESYDVVTNPHLDHKLGGSFGDHTTGTGFMLALNGSSHTNAVVWRETVKVSPDTTYLFSGWGASWGDTGHSFDPSPAILRILINGQQYSADARLAATNGEWRNFTAVWNSQSSTQAVIEIYDENTEWLGNDFALDDLTFSALPSTEVSPAIASAPTNSSSASDISQQVWFPQPRPLPEDGALGFALPDGIGLTYRIQASTDLVHWVQATNVALYFRDRSSTNYHQRFYRFEQK